MHGKLILLVGVPGAGKNTLQQYARETFPELVFPASWTTRPIRPGEVEGETYHFATNEEFDEAIEAGVFLEWVTQDGGRRYGTTKAGIMGALEAGKSVLRQVEPNGVRFFRKLLPNSVVTIFITAGPWEDVSRRMLERAPMSEEELAKRKERYEQEVVFGREADYTVLNTYGKLDEAKKQFGEVLKTILEANNLPFYF